MIGRRRLDHLQVVIEDVLHTDVRGDLLEAGTWRGGAAIFMRAVLAAYGDRQRSVWVADSFQGLPRPDPERYPAEKGDRHWIFTNLAVPIEEVRQNFERYDLLDEQVHFLPGWFRDTLHKAPIERLSVLRLDGDMYGSTMETLESLYQKVSVGGYVVVDDYGAVPACRAAVDDFRAAYSITERMEEIDWTGVFWKRVR